MISPKILMRSFWEMTLMSNHNELQENIQQIRKNTCPIITNDVRKYINNCATCQQATFDGNPPKLQLSPNHKKKFGILHVQTNNQECLTILYKFSRYKSFSSWKQTHYFHVECRTISIPMWEQPPHERLRYFKLKKKQLAVEWFPHKSIIRWLKK